VKTLVFPEDKTNPYQRLLYEEIARLGVEARYLPSPTSSQTLNLLLLPLWLATLRLRGFRLLHLHWVYLFAPAWVQKVPAGRRFMQAWFAACIGVARVLGYRVVWTAHNVLPGSQVFPDDLAARRWLVRHVDAVVAHSAATLPALRSLGAHDVHVIQAGSYLGQYPQTIGREEARRRLGIGDGERVVTFVGIIEEYKGVDLLLEALLGLGDAAGPRVVVAGWCRSAELLRRIASLAERAGERAITRFDYVPDDELQVYLRAADVAAFPFRRITNSSSILLACSFGVPPLVPAVPELADLPDAAAMRYEPTPEALGEALLRVAEADSSQLAAMAVAARAYAASLTWDRTAVATVDLYGELLTLP
jgi:glycosyltransferase involved in cell wall biosynthesis